MSLHVCAHCGHSAGGDYVAMTDQCPRCKVSPFEEAAA